MNGYLRIKNTDLYERDGVTYWRNGGNIIGNVVKAVIEENDVVTSETYYIDSLKTAKPIMLDPDVKIGGLTASESKNGNFIIVETAPADFTEYGGGTGLKITFIYGVNYYSIETVESNGDIKIYDPDGESGTITPDALPDTTDAAAGDVLTLDSDKKPVWETTPTPTIPKKYVHNIIMEKSASSVVTSVTFTIINSDSTPFTDIEALRAYMRSLTQSGVITASGRRFDESLTNPTLFVIYGIFAASTTGNFYFKCDGVRIVDGKLDDYGYGTSFSFSGGTISDTVYEF